MVKISIVIPVLNEKFLISELLKRVKDSVEIVSESYEILLVDDGSQDGTWDVILEEASLNVKIKGLKFSRNFGHHNAITAGVNNAKGDWVIVMDGDLQDRPEVIPDLVEKAEQGFDIVYVSRTNREENSLYLFGQNIFYYFLNFLSGMKFDRSRANFSIINRKVADSFKLLGESSRFYSSSLTWLGYNSTSIQADHGQRLNGRPSYTIKKRFVLAFDTIIAYSDRPLRVGISLGLVTSVLSGIFLAYVLIKSMYSGFSVTGWTSLIAVVTFLSGNILTVLGIIGIYIGRIYREVKSRPLFLISEKINVAD
jgi:glycosyltransferase involved in cell wall biosynthesis